MTAVALPNPRDLEAVFGGIGFADERPAILSTTVEADFRRSLASFAYAYGWTVQEEVVIPGWGRIDIVLDAAGQTFLIELKIDLTKPARIRRAFQQADGYGRWWSANRGRPADVFLCGAQVDDQAVSSVAFAYPMVGAKSVPALLGFMSRGGSPAGVLARAYAAKRRAERASVVGRFIRAAAVDLEKVHQGALIEDSGRGAP